MKMGQELVDEEEEELLFFELEEDFLEEELDFF